MWGFEDEEALIDQDLFYCRKLADSTPSTLNPKPLNLNPKQYSHFQKPTVGLQLLFCLQFRV